MNVGKLFNSIGLKTKLMAVTTAIIILTTIIGSGFFYTRTRTILFQNLRERGRAICENLAQGVKYGVLTEDKTALEEFVTGVLWSEDVVYTLITDEEGKTLAEKTNIKIPDTAELQNKAVKSRQCEASLSKTPSGDAIYNFCYPIIAKKVSLSEIGGLESQIEEETAPRLRGTVRLGLSLKNTTTQLTNILRGITALTFAIIGCAILFSISFVKFVMKPIKQMADAASKVAAGDLSQTVKVESRDEIGRFAQQFNTMTAALKSRDEQLKESYQQLSASEERYRVFIQNSSESIWCFEPKDEKPYPANLGENELVNLIISDSIIAECNDAMAGMYRVKRREDILGRPLSSVMPPAEQDNILNLQTFIRNNYRLTDLEKEDVDDQGQSRITVCNMLGTMDNGRLLRVWVIERDVTDIKKAEQMQMHLFNKVQEVNKELKEFAYVASHDLKAPLRGIKTLAEWLTKDYADKIDDAGKEQLKLLTSRVDRMHNLIDGILQYSRIGRIQEKPTPINLKEMVPDIIDLVAPPSNIEVSVENELPVITFEETRIRQVFQNLISNAIKYMDKPKGKITIGCSDEENQWKFHVTDNGPGIEEKYFEKIFKIFQTLSQGGSNYESTGIGLTLVKKIVELYGGKVWLESKVGQGTTFFFTVLKHSPQEAVKYAELQTNTTD